MSSFLDVFSSRELAAFIWFGVFLFIILLKRNIRATFKALVRSFFRLSILNACLVAGVYVFLITIGLQKLQLWDLSFLKETIFWFLGNALFILFRLPKTSKKDKFFTELLLQNFKLITVLEFIGQVHIFNLVTELIILPIITFLIALQAFAERESHSHSVKTAIDWIFGLSVVLVFYLSLYDVVGNANEFFSLATLKGFLLPILLSLSFIPCAYFMALYMNYEVLFARFRILLGDKNLVRYAKRRSVWRCNIQLERIKNVGLRIGVLYNKSTKRDIKEIIG